MRVYQSTAVKRLQQDYLIYTRNALCAGACFALVFSGPAAVLRHPILPLWSGIAGGIALSQCAERFNRLKSIEAKIASGKTDSREISDRLESLRITIH